VRDDKSNCLVWALMDRVQGPAASVIVCTGFLSIGKRCDRAWAVSLYMAIVAIIEGVGVCVCMCVSLQTGVTCYRNWKTNHKCFLEMRKAQQGCPLSL
jgi:hypothetical protein